MKTKNRKATITNYYDLQELQDKLYAESAAGTEFYDLMNYINSEENIKLAYRAIKTNHGSQTAGTDEKDIKLFANMQENKYIDYIRSRLNNYHPEKVRRVEIPKQNGKTRPLGIPCIEDRIIQQCILQILEPICEAKFYDKSYGFRPNRSTEHAIAECYRLMQTSHLQYVVDVDIKGFFDNVNHRKLIRQMWTLGIKDTKLTQVLKQMLKTPVQMQNGETVYPNRGTPQGGILSPLLANIVLNELDWWIASQWEKQCDTMKKPLKQKYNRNGNRNLGHEYRALRKTQLKEMYIIRYADDFKIFCRNKEDAVKVKYAVIQWLSHRLKLQAAEDKTGITNLKKKYCEFLGFKLKLRRKGKKQVVNAQMCDKAVKRTAEKLKEQIKRIQKPDGNKQLYHHINEYNSMILGIQNYYGIANNVILNFRKIQYKVNKLIENRLNTQKSGKFNNEFLEKRYGKSKQVRWLMGIPIIPIGYYRCRNPMCKRVKVNQYTPEGRAEIYKPPDVDIGIMRYLMRHPTVNRSVEYNDNRISLYVGQRGKCAVTGNKLQIGGMHCHHIKPICLGGDDKYKNLIFLEEKVHILLHLKDENTILKYLDQLRLNEKQLKKLNKLRVSAGLEKIEQKQTICS